MLPNKYGEYTLGEYSAQLREDESQRLFNFMGSINAYLQLDPYNFKNIVLDLDED